MVANCKRERKLVGVWLSLGVADGFAVAVRLWQLLGKRFVLAVAECDAFADGNGLSNIDAD